MSWIVADIVGLLHGLCFDGTTEENETQRSRRRKSNGTTSRCSSGEGGGIDLTQCCSSSSSFSVKEAAQRLRSDRFKNNERIRNHKSLLLEQENHQSSSKNNTTSSSAERMAFFLESTFPCSSSLEERLGLPKRDATFHRSPPAAGRVSPTQSSSTLSSSSSSSASSSLVDPQPKNHSKKKDTSLPIDENMEESVQARLNEEEQDSSCDQQPRPGPCVLFYRGTGTNHGNKNPWNLKSLEMQWSVERSLCEIRGMDRWEATLLLHDNTNDNSTTKKERNGDKQSKKKDVNSSLLQQDSIDDLLDAVVDRLNDDDDDDKEERRSTANNTSHDATITADNTATRNRQRSDCIGWISCYQIHPCYYRIQSPFQDFSLLESIDPALAHLARTASSEHAGGTSSSPTTNDLSNSHTIVLITNVFVKPSHRGMALGLCLVDEACRVVTAHSSSTTATQAKPDKSDVILLSVPPETTALSTYYGALGFRPTPQVNDGDDKKSKKRNKKQKAKGQILEECLGEHGFLYKRFQTAPDADTNLSQGIQDRPKIRQEIVSTSSSSTKRRRALV